MAFDITFRGTDKVSSVSRKISNNVTKDFNQVEKSSKRLRNHTEGLTREIGALRNRFLLASFAAVPIIAGFKQMINEASNLEESINAVNVVFGQGASEILAFGRNSARAIGLATSEFNQLSAVTGALFKDTGLSEREVALQTIELTKRASDLASVFNTSVNDALSAVNQAIRGETEAIRRYAGDITEATLKTHLLSKGLDGNVKALSEMEKRLIRIEVLMKQTDVVAGDFEKTSDNLANQQRILNANIKNLEASFGIGLVPIMENATSALNNFLESLRRGTVLKEFYLSAKALLGLNVDWAEFAKQIERINRQFTPEVIENIGKYGDAMSGNFASALKEVKKLNEELEPTEETFKRLAKEAEKMAAARRAELAARSAQLVIEQAYNEIFKERQKINMNTTATYGAQRDLIELMGTTQRETNESIRDIQGEINERMERQGLIAKRNWMNAQGFYQTEQQISDSARQAALFTQQISNAFLTAAIHGQNLEQSVKSIVKSLAVRGLTAGITSLIPGVGFKDAFFGFQHGGEFRVGGSGGPDSQLVAFRASPNETVTVTPPGQTTNNRNITINIMAPELQSLDDAYTIETKIGPKIEDYLRQRGIA